MNPKLSLALDISLLIKYIGVFTTYTIITSNSIIEFIIFVKKGELPKFVDYVVKACVSLLAFSLSFIKSMEKLSIVSFIACGIVLVTIVTLIVYFCIYSKSGL